LKKGLLGKLKDQSIIGLSNMLIIKNLTVKAGRKKIIKSINFNFKKGKIYAIMGPNGSGKSTFANSIISHRDYQISSDSKILFNNCDITKLETDKIASKGIFLSFQTPPSLSGITVYQLLQMALKGKKDVLELRKEIGEYARDLGINEELLNRSLNEGFSGGEKKKIEVLQSAVINPKLIIYDEIDTGVDIDSLKLIGCFLNKIKKDKTIILITHYSRILHYLRPNKVIVLVKGEIKKIGDYKLAKEIEKKGYQIVNG